MMELFLDLNLNEIKNYIRDDELRDTVVQYLWDRFEIGIIDNDADFRYDLEFLKKLLSSVNLREDNIISILLFLNMLRYSLLNNSSSSSIMSILVSFQTEARTLYNAFKSWYQS
jgi:hypothetical protein